MKCPNCNEEMKKGVVIVDNGEMSDVTLTLNWYPDSERNKKNKKGSVPLALKGEGYYCDNCMKVYATHDMHFNSIF
ncbi:MAG: PF20097 family protein [Lachnospiraceae bacterium]|nr:PF20097 family protein [Lachnospiraceae bacterium]